MRKKISFLTILLSLIISFGIMAQDIDLSFRAKTGSAEFDLTLVNLNIEAKADLTNFKADLSINYKVPVVKIDYLFETMEMEPADVYMSLEIAALTNKTLDDVIIVYDANRDKGWGFITKEMGIKPGSEKFKALKTNAAEKLNRAKGKGKVKK